MSKGYKIARKAILRNPSSLHIGPESVIERKADIARNVTIGGNSRVGEWSFIGESTYVGNGVKIGPRTKIFSYGLLLDGAQICPNPVRTHSTDARTLYDRASVGPGVLLHDEVELGYGAIIPTQRTIASLGNFGVKNRVVTIYGSDIGPRISIGCQIGVSFETIVDRISDRSDTEEASASTYEPFKDIFSSIGLVVQTAYDKETGLVEEIKAMREDLIRLPSDPELQ